MSEKLIEELERRLNAKTIHDLRQIARAVGVPRPADGRKERILDEVLQIASGNSDPAEPAIRGAHPKSAEYDRQLVADILRCREISLAANEGEEKESQPFMLSVSSGVEFDPLDFTAEGILEYSDGRWFIRVNDCRENLITDIFVNEHFITRYSLRSGDLILGKCKRSSLDELAGLASIISINGVSPENSASRLDFENLTPIYPDKRIKVECNSKDFTGRIIDLFAPLAEGQRALIFAPHGCGKTAVLKDIAKGVKLNNPKFKTIILLIDARPEEASDFKRTFPDTDVFTSPFDAGVNGHIRTARLALDYAKRQAETGKSVVLILDDLTRLTKAFNSLSKQVYSALDIQALDGAKKFLASAKNTEEGASLTIVSALSSEGDALDEAIYCGLKDLANMKISLSLKLARSRIYPPVDITASSTYGDDKLLSSEEIKTADKLRIFSTEKLFALLDETENNDELCKNILG